MREFQTPRRARELGGDDRFDEAALVEPRRLGFC